MEPEADPVLAKLRHQVAGRGLELRLDHLYTPGQLAFAVPVRGLDTWRATLRRDGKRVAYGDGITQVAAIRDALRALDRPKR